MFVLRRCVSFVELTSSISLLGECENRIETLRNRLRTQSETIRVRNEEKKRLNEEARRLRQEADSACLRGTMQREMQVGRNHRALLEEAERKMRSAIGKEREANDLQRLVTEGDRNIQRMCDQMLVNGRARADAEQDRRTEEQKVADMAQNLERYKREIGNCLTAARNLREEEARLNREAGDKEEKADRLEMEARRLEEEAARSER